MTDHEKLHKKLLELKKEDLIKILRNLIYSNQKINKIFNYPNPDRALVKLCYRFYNIGIEMEEKTSISDAADALIIEILKLDGIN